MTQTAPAPFFFPCCRGRRPACGRAVRAICILALCLFAGQAYALPPQRLLLDPPVARFHNDALTLALSITVDNEDGLRDLLKDGAVLELLITASLERQRSWWSNAEVAHREFSSTIRHDPLTRDFLVAMPTPEGVTELRDRNLTRLLYASWKKLLIPITTLEQIAAQGDEEEEYGLTLTVNLHHTEVPPWLEKSFVFWSADIVPQEKRTLPVPLPGK